MSKSEQKLLATLSEEDENKVQINQLWDRTVDAEKSIMHLPVTEVTTAENSEKYVLDVEHPVLGELQFFVDKPLTGWSGDELLVKLFDWYRIADRNPYKLQLKQVYVQHTGGDPEHSRNWVLVPPPGEPTRREKLSERIPDLSVIRPKRSITRMYGMLFLGALSGSVGAMLAPGFISGLMLAIVMFLTYTAIGVVVLEP